MPKNESVTLAVYRKGAITVEALLRGSIKFSGRKLFRQALDDELRGRHLKQHK